MRAKTGCGGQKKGPTKKKNSKSALQGIFSGGGLHLVFKNVKKRKIVEVADEKGQNEGKNGLWWSEKRPYKKKKFKVSPPRNILRRWSAFSF